MVVHLSAEVIDLDGVACLLAITRDITEQKRAAEKLERSEAKYRALVENSPFGIYQSTVDGRFLGVNPALMTMLGYQSASQMLTLDIARDIYADEYERVTAQLAPNDASYIVIVTRGHRDDMRVLRWAAETPARYIGMIGSQRKTIAIYKELEKEGIAPEKLARVYAPVGLDIGAITPEEIAVAIVAELIAVRRNSSTPLPHMKSAKAAEILKQL